MAAFGAIRTISMIGLIIAGANFSVARHGLSRRTARHLRRNRGNGPDTLHADRAARFLRDPSAWCSKASPPSS